MQVDIFITCDEIVELLNEVVSKAGCAIFIANDREQNYKSMVRVSLQDIMQCRNMELGKTEFAAKLLNHPVKDIYREDRVGFVSVHPECAKELSNVLLSATFTADSSDVAINIFKVLRKILSRSAHKGVTAINDKTEATGISKGIYWTDEALATKKVWRQAENSVVRFEPLGAGEGRP